MNISIDFSKNKSIGNVYDDNVPNNKQLFDEAEKMYRQHKLEIDGKIDGEVSAFQPMSAGDTIEIKTSFRTARMIGALIFEVERLDKDNCFLALKQVKL